MIIPDTNLLIYAYDSTAQDHLVAKRWWEKALSDDVPVGIPWIVVLAFTRLMSHPTIAQKPLTISQVKKKVEVWFSLSHVRLLSPSANTFKVFFELLESVKRGGNLSTDAMIAAAALEYSGVVYTNDHDFSRFPGLKWKNPL